ncbi:protein LURP-one-related 5-like [Vigna unguiculata]|uniref:Translation initiation factor eIF-2B subunit alpha n=1 Tax=Vigna unguiculata TaxID=3917 RepID=A0A4D6MPR4_VIGUN|nr:protein LURP-one-related 5-like [Vigna unguiculata]QCE02119.1 translation initiation factor eIF-2B subunit alpha [Vigna unguiculata]
MREELVVQEVYVSNEERNLTVLKTSLFFNGDGFAVYDSKGQLVFRFDSYGPRARDKDELVLMDPNGRSLLTLRRKKPSLHQRWEGFRGERREGDIAVFSVKRSSIIGRSRTSVAVEVYDRDGVEYLIEGCFRQRWCKVLNAAKEVVAEIRRKVDPTTSVMLGKEVFWLCVKPGFDAAFAMGLVLVLDEMNGENYFVDRTEDLVVHSAAEDPGLVSPLPV